MHPHPNKSIFLTLKYWRAAGIKNLDIFEDEESEEDNREAKLQLLTQKCDNCNACSLSEFRKTIIFGKGSARAKIMFIGAAPDDSDESLNSPFTGDYGELQQRIIKKMGLLEEDVYLTQTVKCRPNLDKIPQNIEINTCSNILLEKEIEIIQPKIICTLGTIASANLLKTNAPISKIRGQIQYFRKIPVMPTYHPTYLLNKTSARHDVWDDMQRVLDILKSE
jgi:uracil-DNA glycosylase